MATAYRLHIEERLYSNLHQRLSLTRRPLSLFCGHRIILRNQGTDIVGCVPLSVRLLSSSVGGPNMQKRLIAEGSNDTALRGDAIVDRPLYKVTDCTVSALHTLYERKVGDYVSNLESSSTILIPPTSPFVIRLDGCSFSGYTRNVKKPFDRRITDAIFHTAADMLCKFNCVTVYCQSDEISMVFPPVVNDVTGSDVEAQKKPRREDKVHTYNGRVQKLVSVTAGYATARFNYHIAQSDWSDLNPIDAAKMMQNSAYFDSRIVFVKDMHDAMLSLYVRSNCDGFRNAISHITHELFGKKALHHNSITKQLSAMYLKGVDPTDDYDIRNIFGVWLKKGITTFQAINQKTKENVTVTRSKPCYNSFDFSQLTEGERVMFTEAKVWLDSPTFPPKLSYQPPTK